MRCPFLREAQVKSCQASAYRKMLVRTLTRSEEEKCLSSSYVSCPAAKQHHEELPAQSRCPFLQESLVQYCSAAPVTKFVPYSDSPFSRCSNESHKFCELYNAMLHPTAAPAVPSATDDEPEEYLVGNIRMPAQLLYAMNHMWFDLNTDGTWHVGLDALLLRVFGPLERITFVSATGLHRPTVILTVRSTDLQMVFPHQLMVTGMNTMVRTNPHRLTVDPYTVGWLFEGITQRNSPAEGSALHAGLIAGKKAAAWMEAELHQINRYVHEQMQPGASRDSHVMNDGGAIVKDLAAQLTRDQVLHLFNEFFSPYASLRRYQ